jgi:hypothetical protein
MYNKTIKKIKLYHNKALKKKKRKKEKSLCDPPVLFSPGTVIMEITFCKCKWSGCSSHFLYRNHPRELKSPWRCVKD